MTGGSGPATLDLYDPGMALPRLRQVVLAVGDLPSRRAEIETALGVRDPYVDPAVAHFGLRNAVYEFGDCFIELISPTTDGTAAGRWLDRTGGDGGYMAMFEVADEGLARDRIAESGVRVVHDSTHPDIVDIHLHPKDVGGAIVALDVARPPGSWRWGGPAWHGRTGGTSDSYVRGLTIRVPRPQEVAARWARLLGCRASDNTVHLTESGQQLTFLESGPLAAAITEVALQQPGREGTRTVAGVRFRHGCTGGEGAK